MIPSLLETLARQILNEDSDILENAAVENTARLYAQHCTIALSGLTRTACKIPRGPPAVQSYRSDVTHFISWHYCDMDLHEKARHILCTSWSYKWLPRFNGFDVNAQLAEVYVIYGATIKSVTKTHPSVGLGCFGTQDLDKGEPVGHHYSTNLYPAPPPPLCPPSPPLLS